MRTSVQHISKNSHPYTLNQVGGNIDVDTAMKLVKEAERMRLAAERLLAQALGTGPAITDEEISIPDACRILGLTYTPKNKSVGNFHGNYDGRKIIMKMVKLGIIKGFNRNTRKLNRVEVLHIKSRIEKGDINTTVIRNSKLNQ